MRNRIYFLVNSKVLFTSKPTIKRSGKDQMLSEDKSLVVYKFIRYRESSNFGQSSCHLKTRVKKHVLKCIISYISVKK